MKVVCERDEASCNTWIDKRYAMLLSFNMSQELNPIELLLCFLCLLDLSCLVVLGLEQNLEGLPRVGLVAGMHKPIGGPEDKPRRLNGQQ